MGLGLQTSAWDAIGVNFQVMGWDCKKWCGMGWDWDWYGVHQKFMMTAKKSMTCIKWNYFFDYLVVFY